MDGVVLVPTPTRTHHPFIPIVMFVVTFIINIVILLFLLGRVRPRVLSFHDSHTASTDAILTRRCHGGTSYRRVIRGC